MGEIFNASTQDALLNTYAVYVFVPVLLGILFWRRLIETQKLIFYITVLTAINHTLTSLIKHSGSNVWVYHLYVPALFYLTWKIYSKELRKLFPPLVSKVILILVLAFCAFNTAFLQNLGVSPTNSIFVLSAVFIFWCVGYFYSLLQETELKPLEKLPIFWFNAGVLLYYSSTVILFLLVFNFLEDQTETKYIALILNAIFNLVLVTSYIISLWVKPQV